MWAVRALEGVSTRASHPGPATWAWVGHMAVPSGGPRCKVDKSRGRDSQAPALGFLAFGACRVQIGVSEVDSDSGCYLDRWAECGLLGVSGPSRIRPKRSPVPAPRAPGSGTPRRRGSACSAHLGSPPALTGKSPRLQGPPTGTAESCPGSGLVKGTCRLDSLPQAARGLASLLLPPSPRTPAGLYPAPPHFW